VVVDWEPFIPLRCILSSMHQKSLTPLFILLAFAASSAGCRPDSLAPINEAVQTLQDCPATQPPNPPFVPPSPWPLQPPGEGEFWYGENGLWTALPKSGSWRQLALGEKFWWWSEGYPAADVSQDPTPDLSVTAERLDGPAASFHVSEATNGYHSSFNQAMLVGVELPEPGCWQFTAQFEGSQLAFVIWVPGE